MRYAGSLVLVVVCVLGGWGSTGCKNKGEADPAPDPAALKAQQDLIAKRDKLLQTRQQLQSDRDKLTMEIGDIEAKGGDASEQRKKLTELTTQLDSTTNEVINVMGSKPDVKPSGDRSVQMAAREAEVGSREKSIADREARLADREKAFAQREAESAQRWKDSCSMAAPMIIQQAAPPKGGTYTKKDVSDLIAKARATMAKKGVLTADLPGPAQSLDGEASKALNDNDMSKAYFAAAQLQGMVDAIQVNRAFIQAKTARLSAQAKSSKVDEGTNTQLASILTDVMQKYNDGDFTAANKRLNTLAGLLAKSSP